MKTYTVTYNDRSGRATDVMTFPDCITKEQVIKSFRNKYGKNLISVTEKVSK